MVQPDSEGQLLWIWATELPADLACQEIGEFGDIPSFHL